MRAIVGALAVAAGMTLSACGGAEGDTSTSAPSKTLYFTAIPGDDVTQLQEKFAPFEKHMSAALGVDVKYRPAADYSASVESFISGDVHLAWFGGLTGVRARNAISGARAIAQGKADPEYHTYFIAHKDSGLKKGDSFPKDLAGKKFTFGSQSSTSGRLMPEHFIRLNSGKSPTDFFGAPASFSGSHEKTAQLVQAGTFQAGAIDYKTYDRLVAEKKVDPATCFVIWKTPAYPDYNWTAHPDLEEIFGAGFIEKLQKALIAVKDPALLKAVNRPEGLIFAKNEDWNHLAKLAKELNLLR